MAHTTLIGKRLLWAAFCVFARGAMIA